MKIKIFACNSISKIHPRIEMEMEILRSVGHDVELIRTTKKKDGIWGELYNYTALKFFRKSAINKFKKQLNNCDVAHIYDLQLLPLVYHAKHAGIKTIYETLDDNVPLHFYELNKRLKLIGIFKKLIIGYFSKQEFRLSQLYCDAIIVNSPNLVTKFDSNKTHLIYYASQLESATNTQYSHDKETRFIYLGRMVQEKGALIYSNLIEKYGLKLIFYGQFGDSFSKNVFKDETIDSRGDHNQDELLTALKDDMKNFNLIGLSIILPVHESYALQEANKDIDYMAMKIPFIGNDRIPTMKKIKAGAGVLYTESDNIERLISNDQNLYNEIINNDETLYKPFSTAAFRGKLLDVYSSIIN